MESALLCNVYKKRALLNSSLSSRQVLLALNHELSMCSRLSWLIFPRSQATHDLLVPLARPLARTEIFQRFGRSRLMTLSTVYAIAL